MQPSLAGRRVAFKRRRVSTPKDGTVVVSSSQASLALAKKVSKLSKLVKGIQPELKFFTGSGTFANVTDTAGAAASVCLIPAGVDQSERISDRIRVKRFQLQVRISSGSGSVGATPTAEEFSRFYLVQDTQQVSDTVVTPTDVIQNISNPSFPILNVSNALGRYKMLWFSPLFVHARIASASVAGAVAFPNTVTQTPVALFDKQMDLIITYNGTAATDIQKNGLFLVISTNLAADTLDADFNYRISYLDD